MNNDLRPGSEPIKGYTLIGRLGKGGFGEVWKATGPGGFHVALKFVALEGRVGTAELRALDVIKSIRHPHLLANFGSWQNDGQLIIAMELADKTLSDRLNECVDLGLPGIPAPEIFEYFVEAAKGLDFLNEPRHPTGEGGTQGIQHRDIKPQNLLLVGGSVKVADFGLARMLEHSTTGHTGGMTPVYAPPEFFQEKTTSQSDQYSLAVTYCQLRGGRLPFEGNPAAVLAGKLYREPDLSMLPEGERGAVARALAKPSRERWPSCRAFVQAMMEAEGVEVPITRNPTDTGWKKTTERDEFSSGPGNEPWPDFNWEENPKPGHDETRKWSVQVLGVWALVAAVLLVAAILLFARGKPEVAVASKTPGNGNPDPKSQGTAERPGGELTKPTPPITANRPEGELTKSAPPIVPAAAKSEKNTMAIQSLIDRGLSYVAAEDAEKAIGQFDEAIRLDPGNAEAHAGLAFAYGFGAGIDNKKGLDEANRAVRLDPKSALAHAARGNFLSRRIGNSQDISGALAECDEALRLDPTLALGHLVKAQAYNRMFVNVSGRTDDHDKAFAEILAAIQLDPKLAHAYAAKANALRIKGNLDLAMADIDTALRLNPRSLDALFARAQIWLAKRDYSRAIEDCNRFIEINPNHVQVYRVRSACYDAKGNKAKAKADYDESERIRRDRNP